MLSDRRIFCLYIACASVLWSVLTLSIIAGSRTLVFVLTAGSEYRGWASVNTSSVSLTKPFYGDNRSPNAEPSW